MLSAVQIADICRRRPLADVAIEFGAQLRRSGGRMVGSCPVCGGGRSATRFSLKTPDAWVCAVCNDGGDVIALVQRCTGRTFLEAVEFLGGARELTDAERAALERRRLAEEKRRAADQHKYRERERAAAFAIWAGHRTPMVETDIGRAYLARRNIDLTLPLAGLRFAPALPYFHGRLESDDGRAAPRVIHRGPAMVAAAQGPDGHFTAVHMTWIDLADPKGKARLVDPDTGEALASKKSRGSTRRGVIKLTGAREPTRLFVGEGNETTLVVASCLKREGRLRAGDAFWSTIDLGNLGGPATETIRDTTRTLPNGRHPAAPGPEPTGDSWLCPDSVRELVTLGDSDSDPFLTRLTHERAARRYARPGRIVRAAWAEPGKDFDDMLRGAA